MAAAYQNKPISYGKKHAGRKHGWEQAEAEAVPAPFLAQLGSVLNIPQFSLRFRRALPLSLEPPGRRQLKIITGIISPPERK